MSQTSNRRSFLANVVMLGGLVGSFGTALAFAARYIYPHKGLRRVRAIFLAPIQDIHVGKGKVFELPTGGTALVTHTGADVVAISNVCPHLGCKVHWEDDKRRFYCPCHGGEFDPSGKAVGGPPADEGKDLTKFPLQRVGENLFIEVEEIVKL